MSRTGTPPRGIYLGVVAGRLAGGSLEALSLGAETGDLCGLLGDIAYAGHGDAGDVHGDIIEGGVGADGDETARQTRLPVRRRASGVGRLWARVFTAREGESSD
jgi:hypothetical protein